MAAESFRLPTDVAGLIDAKAAEEEKINTARNRISAIDARLAEIPQEEKAESLASKIAALQALQASLGL